MRQNPSRWKTGMCLRFQLLRLTRNVFSYSLERGRLHAREKPSHPLLGDVGEKPHLGSIAVQQRSGIDRIVPADNFPSPDCTGGQIKQIEPCTKNSTRKHKCEKHYHAYTTYGIRSIHAAFLFPEHQHRINITHLNKIYRIIAV